MKINVKLLLLTFTIITLVSVSSAFIYHTLTKKILLSQQSKALVNSADDFIFEFQEMEGRIDKEFYNNFTSWKDFDINRTDIDFAFISSKNFLIDKNDFKIKKEFNLYTEVNSILDLVTVNSNLLIREKRIGNQKYYYGIKLTTEKIEDLSEKIRADVAFVEDNVISTLSNKLVNQEILPYLSEAARELNTKNNFEQIYKDLSTSDFFATHITNRSSSITNKTFNVIVFTVSKEAAEFRSTMNLVTAVIVVSGVFLIFIFSFLFTSNFRKQISYIIKGVSEIAEGKLNTRVTITAKDEIGKLGEAFNNMLDEIEQRDSVEKEYLDLISLINQNPSLEEVGELSLQKIVSTTGADIGGLYLYEANELIPHSVFGFSDNKNNLLGESSFYKRAKENKEFIELHFEDNQPIVKTGLIELKLNHLYILPIVYNNEVIAIMELASANNPEKNIKEYFERIKDQLSIGLANAKALGELKKLVAELKELNDAYQEQNVQITEKNEQLLKLHTQLKQGSAELEIQKTKAVESAILKSQFLANMSHELRTPQNSILGLTELVLKDESTSSKTKERLNVVLRNGKKLLNLIENILEFSKLESGNIEIAKSKIQLTELADEVASFIEPLFFEREVNFTIQLPVSSNYTIETDVKKIEQIIFNLVGNASKFTKEGYVHLAIEVEDDSLKIIVEDTGPGIKDSDKKMIFEEFRQVDAELNRKFSGSGLGLTICKRYTELLEGSIAVESNNSKGTRFIVELPNVIVSEIEKAQNRFMKTHSEPSEIRTLLISDGNDSVELITDFLSSNKIAVETKDTKEVSISYLIENQPDLIIFDVSLSDNYSWELLYKIKKHNIISEIPITILNMDEEANCGLGLPVLEYYTQKISKPNVHRAIEQFEKQQGIKFRNLLFVMNDKEYDKIEDELIFDELKINQINGNASTSHLIKEIEPDLIIVDLFDKNINSFLVLSEIAKDEYSKNIPVVAFVEKLNDKEEIKTINNKLIEATLISQNHPLEALKTIKNRIDLINNSIFNKKVKEDSFGKVPVIKNEKRNEKIKVMVVDDDNDALFTIGEIIDNFGYEPIYASDGFECLKKLEKESPELILLDIMMPKMDGFETVKRIRENPKFNSLTVFALTAYAMLSDKEIIEKNGFDGLFTKPINTNLLEKKLNSIFSRA
ncbi:MAG: response regulator [Ignavibacteriae bacterium]|nr:response regulator [Ignavibacteriota bacterium]